MIVQPQQIKKNLSKHVWIYETSQENKGKKVFCNGTIIPPEYQGSDFVIDKDNDFVGTILETEYMNGRFYFWVLTEDTREILKVPLHQVREIA